MKTKRVTNNSLENCNKTKTDQIIERYKKNLPVLNCKFNSSANLRLRNLLLVLQKNSCYNEGFEKIDLQLEAITADTGPKFKRKF